MFKKLFGGKQNRPKDLLESLLQDLFEKGGFALSADFKVKKGGEIFIELFGEDEGLLKTRDGRLLIALQTYLNRVTQHHFFDQDVFVRLDSGGFFEEKDKWLLDLVEKLKQKALSTGRPVYLRKDLSPFQRRKVHKFLAELGDVKSSSVGEGAYKNICISPLTHDSFKK